MRKTIESFIVRLRSAMSYVFIHKRFAFEIFTMIFILAVICIQESFWPTVKESKEVPNFLLISGALTMLLFVLAAKNIFGQIENTLRRLVKRRSILMKQSDLEEFVLQLRRKSNIWGVVGGVASLITTLVLFYYFEEFKGFKESSQSTLSILGSFIGGRYSAEMLCFGFLGRSLRKKNATIIAKPRHVDGAAGLKPIGDYYFYQGKLVAIPAVFMIGWWFIKRAGIYPDTAREDLYLILFFVFLVLEILVFVLPMISFHDGMLQKKVDHLVTADELGLQIENLYSKIAETDSEKQRDVLKNRAQNLADIYWNIENMPTWPVDMKTRRHFALNNMVLFLPIVTEIAKKKIFGL